MAGERPWTPGDRTGGPLDDILDAVRLHRPDATITRMVGTHPADDNNVYWVTWNARRVQVDTGDAGSGPFVIEGAAPGTRLDTSNPSAALHHVFTVLEAEPGSP